MKGLITTAVLFFGLSGLAQAETMGLFVGRSADLSTHSGLSFEVGANLLGDDVYGVRANYSISDTMVAYADVGLGEAPTGFYSGYYSYYSVSRSKADGIYFGGGLFYQLSPFVPDFDFALRGSYHTGDFDTGSNYDVAYSEFSVDLIVSLAEELNNSGIQAYAIVGVERVASEFDGPNDGRFIFDTSYSDTDMTLGGGMILPLSNGEVYAGLRLLGGFSLGGGYRFNF